LTDIIFLTLAKQSGVKMFTSGIFSTNNNSGNNDVSAFYCFHCSCVSKTVILQE